MMPRPDLSPAWGYFLMAATTERHNPVKGVALMDTAVDNLNLANSLAKIRLASEMRRCAREIVSGHFKGHGNYGPYKI